MDAGARYRRRFILQSDSYSCGPVAVHNAMVWQRGQAPDWSELVAECKPCPETGTSVCRMLAWCVSVRTSKLSRMRSWLIQGHGFILLYGKEQDKTTPEMHYVFIHPSTDDFETNSKVIVRNAICPQTAPDYRHAVVHWDRWADLFGRRMSCMGTEVPVAWRIPRLTTTASRRFTF